MQRLREREQAARRQAASKRDFVANAAHQLRTPLAALRLAGEDALKAGISPRTAEEAVGQMLEKAGRCSRLVERLLALARLESGAVVVHSARYDGALLVRELLEWFGPLAEERGIKLRAECSGRAEIFADKELFRLALENFLDNSIKYSPAGGEVTVRVKPARAGGVAVEVVDEGPGLDEEALQRLLERFWRGVSNKSSGARLGLAIARWAAALFGAKIEYEARIGGGSVFRLICPQSEEEDFASDTPELTRWQECETVWAEEAGSLLVLARTGSWRAGLTDKEAALRRANSSESREWPLRLASAANGLWLR